MQEALELRLKKELKNTRLLLGLAALTGLIALIWLATLINTRSSMLIVLLLMGSVYIFCFSLAFFIGSLVCRFESVPCGEDTVTVYRALSHNILYINGQEKDRTRFGHHAYYLESQLSDGSTVTVAFARWYRFRITFSNGKPPVEF